MKSITLTSLLLCCIARAEIFYPTITNPDFEQGTNGWTFSGGGQLASGVPLTMDHSITEKPRGEYCGLLGMTPGTVWQLVPYVAGQTNRFIIHMRSAHTPTIRTFFVHWQGGLPSREHIVVTMKTTGTNWTTQNVDFVPSEQLSSLARLAVYGDCAAFEFENFVVEPPPPPPPPPPPVPTTEDRLRASLAAAIQKMDAIIAELRACLLP